MNHDSLKFDFSSLRALVFYVFGTCIECRSSITGEANDIEEDFTAMPNERHTTLLPSGFSAHCSGMQK